MKNCFHMKFLILMGTVIIPFFDFPAKADVGPDYYYLNCQAMCQFNWAPQRYKLADGKRELTSIPECENTCAQRYLPQKKPNTTY